MKRVMLIMKMAMKFLKGKKMDMRMMKTVEIMFKKMKILFREIIYKIFRKEMMIYD